MVLLDYDWIGSALFIIGAAGVFYVLFIELLLGGLLLYATNGKFTSFLLRDNSRYDTTEIAALMMLIPFILSLVLAAINFLWPVVVGLVILIVLATISRYVFKRLS